MFYNVLLHYLWLKYCRGCLIWFPNGQNLPFVQRYLCFFLLRGDLNICGMETDEKLTRLCSSSMDVLPSKSSSWSHDWKLSILLIFSRFWYLILFTWRIFLAFKIGRVVNNICFCGVTNSKHTFNIDFTWTLIWRNVHSAQVVQKIKFSENYSINKYWAIL